MTYQSNRPAVTNAMRAAADAGLRAAAQVGVNATQQKLAGGWARMAWPGPPSPTGTLMASVHMGEPFDVGGGRAILYGTDVQVAVWWELGFNKWPAYFSEKLQRWVSVPGPTTFHRHEVWVPTFFALRGEFMAAYEREYRRVMGSGGSGFGGSRAASPRSPR